MLPAEVETPRVLIDRRRLTANIEAMQRLADSAGVRLRPHIKTHKSLEIGRLQRDAGAAGITASKVGEALVFIEDGFPSVTVAYPLPIRRKVERLLKAAHEHDTDLALMIDSNVGLNVLQKAVDAARLPVGVYIKIDVGLHRCGLPENDPQILDLARAIRQTPGLVFRGLLSHAGHAYGAENREQVEAIAESERQTMLRVRQRLINAGCPVPEISVGSTPSVLAAARFEGITEIRPGNYVFLDNTPLRLALAAPEDVALSVIATIVSMNPNHLIIDCGSKVLSSDQGAHGSDTGQGFGTAYPWDRYPDPAHAMTVEKLSEEHGFIRRRVKDPHMAIGDRIRVIPNHACPVANLTDHYLVLSDRDGVRRWPVDARGCVR